MLTCDATALAVMEKSALRARDESLSLDADVGKTAQVSLAAAPADQIGAGWYCQACDRQFKDNKSWLDHLNSQMRTVYGPNCGSRSPH